MLRGRFILLNRLYVSRAFLLEKMKLAAVLFVAVVAFAQDPYATLPKNYSLEFENSCVRVSRGKNTRPATAPEHSHPESDGLRVRNDGGRVRFSHETPRSRWSGRP
jgi:hypothetical protein